MNTPACTLRIALCLAASSFILSSPARSGDWPGWRGPNRDGISTETGLLKSWPEGGPKLLWEVEGCGEGYSSVAIVDGKVFTLGKTKDGEAIFAFSAGDGKALWKTVFGREATATDHLRSTGKMSMRSGWPGILFAPKW